MKVLLDENISNSWIKELTNHQVESVKTMGWLGKKNGELLGLAVLNKFEAFVTWDKQLQYQQNLTKFELAVIVVRTFQKGDEDLSALIEKLKTMLNNPLKKGLYEVSNQ